MKNVWALILLALIINGCATSVRPHQPKPGDFVYKITAVKGGGAHAVGEKICLYCPPPYTTPRRCTATKTIEPADGIQYDLVNLSSVCTTCPGDAVDYYED